MCTSGQIFIEYVSASSQPFCALGYIYLYILQAIKIRGLERLGMRLISTVYTYMTLYIHIHVLLYCNLHNNIWTIYNCMHLKLITSGFITQTTVKTILHTSYSTRNTVARRGTTNNVRCMIHTLAINLY